MMNHVADLKPPFAGVKSVLVVFSSKAQAFDAAGLRNLITHAYSGSAVFFVSTSGDPVGVEGPNHVDLLIDFTPPGARQSFFLGRKLLKRAKFTVGRKSSGLFAKKFDRSYDEAADAN